MPWFILTAALLQVACSLPLLRVDSRRLSAEQLPGFASLSVDVGLFSGGLFKIKAGNNTSHNTATVVVLSSSILITLAMLASERTHANRKKDVGIFVL